MQMTSLNVGFRVLGVYIGFRGLGFRGLGVQEFRGLGFRVQGRNLIKKPWPDNPKNQAPTLGCMVQAVGLSLLLLSEECRGSKSGCTRILMFRILVFRVQSTVFCWPRRPWQCPRIAGPKGFHKQGEPPSTTLCKPNINSTNSWKKRPRKHETPYQVNMVNHEKSKTTFEHEGPKKPNPSKPLV